jgi:hypothetical protein
MIIITALLGKDPRPHRIVIAEDKAHGMEVCNRDRRGDESWQDAKESAHKHTAMITKALLVLQYERACRQPDDRVTNICGGIEIALGKVDL